MKCYYLEGENIKPATAKEARSLIGKRVRYLQRSDIDRSGRGFFFPRDGVIAAVQGREIAMDYPNNFVATISELVEMIEVRNEAV